MPYFIIIYYCYYYYSYHQHLKIANKPQGPISSSLTRLNGFSCLKHRSLGVPAQPELLASRAAIPMLPFSVTRFICTAHCQATRNGPRGPAEIVLDFGGPYSKADFYTLQPALT